MCFRAAEAGLPRVHLAQNSATEIEKVRIQPTLFDDLRTSLTSSVELTAQSLNAYGSEYRAIVLAALGQNSEISHFFNMKEAA